MEELIMKGFDFTRRLKKDFLCAFYKANKKPAVSYMLLEVHMKMTIFVYIEEIPSPGQFDHQYVALFIVSNLQI
jgi:hypothetical protein